jgi:hypothetical protein
MQKIKHLLRAIWMWADLWDICWWNNNNPDKRDSLSCSTAWEVSKKIWLED